MIRGESSQIKQENKKAFSKFLVTMILSTLIGAVVGVLSVKIQKFGTDAFVKGIMELLGVITPYSIAAITGITAIVVTLLYQKGKARYNAWDGEDDQEIDEIECLLTYGLYIVSLDMILSLLFLAVGLVTFRLEEFESIRSAIPAIVWFVSFVLTLVFVTVSQRTIVDLVKQINPEKRGSIYDTDFTKKWEESCDEAEWMITYKSAYKSYKSVSTTCLILWMFCIIGSIVFEFGILPVTMVSIIWIVLITSFTMESIKLSKHK